MREILFRGKKDDLPCVFVYGQLIVCDNGDCLISKCNHYGDTCYSNKVFPDTVGQYTESNDIKGEAIYEGDVLKTDIKSFLNGYKAILGVVVFEEGAFGIRTKRGFTSFTGFCNTTFERIGNIHDNPELMEM